MYIIAALSRIPARVEHVAWGTGVGVYNQTMLCSSLFAYLSHICHIHSPRILLLWTLYSIRSTNPGLHHITDFSCDRPTSVQMIALFPSSTLAPLAGIEFITNTQAVRSISVESSLGDRET